MNTEPNRRVESDDRPVLAGVPVRDEDIEGAKGLHSAAILFRVMSGLIFVLMVMQLLFGLTSTVEISYGVLFAEAVRMLILAGLLWAFGDLAILFVKSHHDVRALRILVARLTYRADPPPPTGTRTAGDPPLVNPGAPAATREPGDERHQH